MQAGLYTTVNVIFRQFACQKVKDAIPRLKSKKEPSDDAWSAYIFPPFVRGSWR